MIADLLPAYSAAHNDNISYKILRSIMIEGHEVAWMEATGTIKYDLMKQGREGQTWVDRRAHCECDFTQGVGWGYWKNPKTGDESVCGLDFKCSRFNKALVQRQLELRKEYQAMYSDSDLGQHIPEIILDLMQKAATGEFMGEGGGGARFWGGYFYMQLVEAITGIDDKRASFARVHDALGLLCRQRKISMEGMVIQPYSTPPAPAWTEHMRLEDEGWVGIASLPAHSQMSRQWKFNLLRPGGEPLAIKLAGLPLDYSPDFGPDIDDVTQARRHLTKLLESAKNGQPLR